jgi:hypothetical protein
MTIEGCCHHRLAILGIRAGGVTRPAKKQLHNLVVAILNCRMMMGLGEF